MFSIKILTNGTSMVINLPLKAAFCSLNLPFVFVDSVHFDNHFPRKVSQSASLADN